MEKWFICRNEEVLGPFTSEELKNRVNAGMDPTDWTVWGPQMDQWKTVSWWLREGLVNSSRFTAKSEAKNWYYALSGKSHGPYTYEGLVTGLKNINIYDKVLVWKKGMKSWIPVFEFHDLIDELGINRRQHPRATINGTVNAEVDGIPMVAQLVSVSEGGLGVRGFSGIRPGHTLDVEIKSNHFFETIRAKVEVCYTKDDGYIGFKFRNISMQHKNSVIEYVRQKSMGLAA